MEVTIIPRGGAEKVGGGIIRRGGGGRRRGNYTDGGGGGVGRGIAVFTVCALRSDHFNITEYVCTDLFSYIKNIYNAEKTVDSEMVETMCLILYK